MPSFETASCCETARPLASKNAGSCLSVWAGPPPTVPRASVLGVRKSVASQEVVVGIVGVDGVGAHLAELGHARQRLAKPSAVAVRQHVDAAPHVVELGEQDVVARRAEPGERLSLGRLEQHVELALPFRNASRSVAISAPAGYVLPPIVQSDRSWNSSHSRWSEAVASSGLSILIELAVAPQKVLGRPEGRPCGRRRRARSRA